jgi:hypothetical protein
MSKREKRRDYDESLPGAVQLTFRGETFEFSPEAPLDVALEWMDRQNTEPGKPAWELLGETQTEYTYNNFECIFREHWDEMRSLGVGFTSLNEAYADLLEWWNLWRRPKTTKADLALNRIRVIVASAIGDATKRANIEQLLDAIEQRLTELEDLEERTGDDDDVHEDEEEKETAGNPA